MIRPINIKLNAAHPELPLVEATTFTGAPSSVFIRGVPKNCGNWSITAVNVAVTYPDNATTTRAAVESAEGVWVATIPGTATSGRTVAGFRILADGIDENGAAVTGYVLGFADFAVLSFFPVPAPGETFFYLRYFDTMPTTAKKMDVTAIDGILKYYNGTAWLPFADLTNYYTKAETDNAIERVAAYYITYNAAGAAFPTRADLINAQTYYSGGVVRVPTRNDYAVVLADETHDGAEWRYIYAVADGQTTGQWEAQYPVEGVIAYDDAVTPTSGNGVKSSGIWAAIWGALAALPTGFSSLYDWCVAQLEGKLSTSGGTVTGNISMVDGILDAGDVQTRSMFDFLLPGQAPKSLAVPENSGKALTDADIGDSSSALGAALAGKAAASAIPYALADPIVVATAQSEVVEGETVYYGAATLADRTANIVQVTTPLDELRITFPSATSGKARDFILALTCGASAPNVTFPAGATIVIDDSTDLTAEEGLNLYAFTEISANTFVASRLLVTAYTAPAQ